MLKIDWNVSDVDLHELFWLEIYFEDVEKSVADCSDNHQEGEKDEDRYVDIVPCYQLDCEGNNNKIKYSAEPTLLLLCVTI